MEPLESVHTNGRILIIGDDEGMRSLLNDFFVGEGFETDSISNSDEVFRIPVKKPFALIVTDIGMPGLTGLDIVPKIKKLQPGVPIIVMAAFGSDEVYRRACERGVTVYLEKPVHFQKLRELIHQMVLSRRASLSPTRKEEGQERDNKWLEFWLSRMES